MRSMQRESVNAVITSPPYNVDLGNNKFRKDGYNSHDDNMPYDSYLAWMNSVFSFMYEVLCGDGRICINIGDGRNGKITTHSDFWKIIKDIGFKPIATIIWNKNTTSNRCAWGSFMNASCPSFPSQMEYILVAGKTDKLMRKGKSTVSKDDFILWSNPLWEFPPENRQKKLGHPAMFPIELPHRCLQLFTYQGDVILDPFMGVGTTGIACANDGRKFIGIEKDSKYFDIAKNRIDNRLCIPKQATLEI